MRKSLSASVAALTVILAAGSAVAQTAITPPNRIDRPNSGAPVPNAPQVPVPDSVVDQAKAQAEGEFPAFSRTGGLGGQVQDAWNDASPNAGVFEYKACDRCTYKVRLREHMVSVLELPDGEVIEGADVGDPESFSVEVRNARTLSVKPRDRGIDSNLVVFGKSGAVYPFYLRAESFNSVNVPDLLVRVTGRIATDGPDVEGYDGPLPASHEEGSEPVSTETKTAKAIAASETPGDDGLSALKAAAVEGLEKTDPETKPDNFVKDVPFDPDKLHGWGEYELWGEGDFDDLRPETVYRDDHFTYIKFGDRWTDTELPTAYVVVDGIDELVNTRVQGTTYIVESTHELITLKSGKSFLCIQYEGEDA